MTDIFFEKTSRVFVSVGMKGSGKTHLALAYIWEAMRRNEFDHYFLCIPAFSSEQNASYHWLRGFPKLVTVAENYHPDFIQLAIDRQKPWLRKKEEARSQAELDAVVIPKIFFFLDDATSFGHELSLTPIFTQLVTKTRHYNITLILCVHTLRSILTPAIRANMDHMIMGAISNQKVLQGIYEEMLATIGGFDNFKHFEAWFGANVRQSKTHNMLLASLRSNFFMNTNDIRFIDAFNKAIASGKDKLIANPQQWARSKPKPPPSPYRGAKLQDMRLTGERSSRQKRPGASRVDALLRLANESDSE